MTREPQGSRGQPFVLFLTDTLFLEVPHWLDVKGRVGLVPAEDWEAGAKGTGRAVLALMTQAV